MKMNNQKKLLTAGDASSALGVSVDTIRRWDKLGLLRSVRDSCNVRLFDPSEIEHAKRQHESPKELGAPSFHVLKSDPTEMTTVELFAGAGGTALGLENAGFENLMLSEIDHAACGTLRHNRPQWNVVGEMSRRSIFPDSKGKSISFRAASPAKRSAMPENRKASGIRAERCSSSSRVPSGNASLMSS